jgi:hypothetical protein
MENVNGDCIQQGTHSYKRRSHTFSSHKFY